MSRDASEDLAHVIPLTLDSPDKFLLWDKDVAGVFIACMMLGIYIEWTVTGVLVGGLAAYGYKRIKSGKHPGLSAHLLYWVCGLLRLDVGAPSHVREYNG